MAWLICCLCSTRIMRQIISYRGRTRATAEQQREPEQGKPTHLTSDRQQVGRACGNCLWVCKCAPIAIPLAQSSTGWFRFRLQFRFIFFTDSKMFSSLSVWKNVANCVCAAGRVDTCLVAPRCFSFHYHFRCGCCCCCCCCWPC